MLLPLCSFTDTVIAVQYACCKFLFELGDPQGSRSGCGAYSQVSIVIARPILMLTVPR